MLFRSECLLIDDGSTDESGDICRKYAKLDPRFRIWTQPNSGSGPARNKGLQYATGKYVFFSDADDQLAPNLLERAVETAEKSTAQLLIFGYVDSWTDARGNLQATLLLPKETWAATHEEVRNRFEEYHSFAYRNLWNKFYLRSYLVDHQITFPDQRVGQDARFNLFVFEKVERVKTISDALYHYYHREGSAVNHYNPQRFKYEWHIASHFEELMAKWERRDVYQHLTDCEYTDAIRVEMRNLVLSGSALKQEEKMARIQWMMENPTIRAAVERRIKQEKGSLYLRGMLILLHQKRFQSAYQVMRWKMLLKPHMGFAHSWLERTERATKGDIQHDLRAIEKRN